jgi:hypothetical protein
MSAESTLTPEALAEIERRLPVYHAKGGTLETATTRRDDAIRALCASLRAAWAERDAARRCDSSAREIALEAMRERDAARAERDWALAEVERLRHGDEP